MRLLTRAGGPRRCLLVLAFALTTIAVGMLPSPSVGNRHPGPSGTDEPAVPVRELSQADTDRVTKLYARAVVFGRAGQFVEAQGPVREILELRTRLLGEDHFETGDARREIETLKKLAALSEADRVVYRKTYVLTDEMGKLWQKGRYAEALPLAEQILDLYCRLLGPQSSYVAVAANRVGQLLHDTGRYASAEAQFRRALDIVRAIVGENHPGTAALYGNLAMSLEKQGKYAPARRLKEMALKITLRLRGETHPATAVAYNNLAAHFELHARYRDAERLYRQVIRALRAREGESSERLATAYNNLAFNLQQQGKYDEVEPLYQRALAIRLKLLGEDHPDTAQVYMNLAANREARGDIAEAEPLQREALRICRAAHGANHVLTAWALNNLAVNLNKQGKCVAGEKLLREALAIVERLPAGQSHAVAKMSSNLASCLQSQDRHADAEALCVRALAILREQLGPDHPTVAVVINNVAATLDAQERYREAERPLREALAILIRRYGENHPETAEARANLGVNLYHQGRFDEAERLFKEALAFQRRVLGEGHPSTARSYKLLVVNCCARGDHAQAAALATAARSSFEAARRRISFAGLDRAGRTAEDSPLPALAVVAARRGQPHVAWQALEHNLARGLLDDLAARPLSAEDRRREQDLLGRLDDLERQVAALPSGREQGANNRSIEELCHQRDAAQAAFVRFQAHLASRYGVAAGEVYDLLRVQARLPHDTALLAWVDLGDQARRADPKGDHWACLVRCRGAPVWVRLPGTGPGGAWTDEDDRLPLRTRRAFAHRPTVERGSWKELARQLARQRLAPLEEHLRAKGDLPAVRHLILLPSPMMAAVPVEALTDTFSVSYAPSGTMFAWLQEQRAKVRRKDTPRRLLALGAPTLPRAPDTGTATAKSAQPDSGDQRERFAPLPGAQRELLSIARLFSEPQLFLGAKASEQNLDQLAGADGLRAFDYLHFATHGILDSQRPMRSALLLSQNQRPVSLRQAVDGKGVGDGRLTAERILRRWKLDAELVTLSACDTGLGRFSGGEGYLGFSQALFLAGARSLVLSLWQVDDTATALLMTRFYENLLGNPEGTVAPMSRVEALAEAKRWLRGLDSATVQHLARDLPTRGTRGRIEPRKGGPSREVVHSYAHPYFWSGFILIGDPW